MFDIQKCKIPGCFLLSLGLFEDKRGTFIKNFNKSCYEEHGLNTEYLEDFYTSSKKNVIRGLHFAKPPSHHVKTITCIQGTIFDVLVDLRIGSKFYGDFEVFELSGTKPQTLYAPVGIAHGFCAFTNNAIVQYKVSKKYRHEDDIGIHWDSIGINWPTKKPIVSLRDKNLPSFSNFQSPFKFKTE